VNFEDSIQFTVSFAAKVPAANSLITIILMKFIPIDYDQVEEISKRDLAFIQHHKDLTDFVPRWASIEAFADAIRAKKGQPIDRHLLCESLSAQYQNINTTSAVKENIEALGSEDTFTVITAHQPSLFTGPLYYIYKICSVINLTKQLNDRYPKYRFVPVFISGGEDHDFDEINHLQLYGKDIVWQKKSHGPVGRLSTEGLTDLIAEIKDILGTNEHSAKLISMLSASVNQAKKYSDVNFYLINEIFQDFGLIYAQMDNAAYKRQLIPIIKDELQQQSSYRIVNETLKSMDALGLKNQASPREINLFYLKDEIRERIIQEGDRYIINNTDLNFSTSELMALVDASPELFSPNVLLRPLYQEIIFPNLAYIGGGGEIAYWTERAAQFAHYDLPFPLLIRRNSALQISQAHVKQIGKTEYSYTDFIKPDQSLINDFLDVHVSEDIDLTEYRTQVQTIFNEVADKAAQIQKPLSKYVLAEAAKQVKSLEHIEAKLKKALKAKNETDINRLTSIRSKLFPNGGLQERYENFIMYYAQHGQSWITQLVNHLDPLNEKFLLVVDE